MKFCYCDESGTGSEPVAVMVGVIVDSQRMHLTKHDWRDLLETLSTVTGRVVNEIHTRDFYAGNTPWRSIPGNKRSRIVTEILEWLNERKHNIVISAINKTNYEKLKNEGKIYREINTIWKALGFHLILAIQKAHQNLLSNKGNTIFVLDNENKEDFNFKKLIYEPPIWSETYYKRKLNQEHLDNIIDVPYFADSKHVPLIQLADFISFFIRRYIEITEGYDSPRYNGEEDRLEDWLSLISARCIASNFTYPKKGRCECAELFFNLAPDCIKNL